MCARGLEMTNLPQVLLGGGFGRSRHTNKTDKNSDNFTTLAQQTVRNLPIPFPISTGRIVLQKRWVTHPKENSVDF